MNSANSDVLPLPTRPTVPRIQPVATGGPRPFWSVMIPTFNCARYLRQALESVLSQDPGPEQMQLEVVDDVSTHDDPEAIVREVGKGRVGFYRNPKNVGIPHNFNVCLDRSKGSWIHILHGDDYVLDGFYTRMRTAIDQFPTVGAVFSRVYFVDETGGIERMSDRVKELENSGRDARPCLLKTPFQFAGVVTKRSFVEAWGGFDQRLIHVADWEMWIRAIHNQGGVVINEALAAYRCFEGNDTSRLVRTAENLKDYIRLRDILISSVQDFHRADFDRMVAYLAVTQRKRFEAIGDLEAARANWDFWCELTPLKQRMYHLAVEWVRKWGFR